MSPRRYSEVANKVASTITMRSATIVPLTMLAPAHKVNPVIRFSPLPFPDLPAEVPFARDLAPDQAAEMMSPTSGAMSPDPVIVNVPADGCRQVGVDGA